MDLKHIRNFSIIAHIDHGKSTLADRMLEVTGTIEARKMRDQVLDNMELERERGITIKMQPVRMEHKLGNENYQLNLIDTPGHIDFSYEVSRALKAVEGSILLVDSTQGVQAQTLTTLEAARAEGLVIVPVVSKIDSPLARVDEVKLEIGALLDIDPDTVLAVSGRTGEGVPELLKAVIERVPSPTLEEDLPSTGGLKALVFDFKYDDHRGVIVYVRIFQGSVKRNDRLLFSIAKEKFIALEVGIFAPGEEARDSIGAGEIGYIVTGVKQPGIASVGDTITTEKNPLPALAGYDNPRPVVWASIYPESQDDFPTLRTALSRLKLSDSAFTFEEESSGALGRGFRAGFLGMLHLEIITERLRREYNLELVVTTPSITYMVTKRNGKVETIYSPHLFPNDSEIISVEEPWANVRIITPERYIGILMPFLYEHEAEVGETETFGEGRSAVTVVMPLREMMRGFFDELKSITSGYASITYTIAGLRPASVTRMDIVLADEVVPAFTRVIARRRAQEEADFSTEKLQSVLPRQQYEMKVQGVALGKILSSKTIKAFRKDVLMFGSKMVGGGDVSRKKKVLEKQKKGKARQREYAKVNIPHEVFLKMMRGGNDN
ncbi:MAG: translation elongation factor 4 [Candidatus Pacebacteria bacterium]|nr:translation elongation factor 4 [Candidatus Paceibacterota bacterium]